MAFDHVLDRARLDARPARRHRLLAAALRRLVVIGGGFAGAALAYHLLQRSSDLDIAIVEKRLDLGRGPAHGTTDPTYLLNVAAEKMSLATARPRDFVEYVESRGRTVLPGEMLPRHLFGEYMEHRIAPCLSRITVHRGVAIAASPTAVTLDDGTSIGADLVVLATGNQPPAPLLEGLSPSRVITDPWSNDALDAIALDDRVLIVGTGLTAVDVIAHLHQRRHRGPVIAFSRRGKLPLAHLAHGDPTMRPLTLDRLPSTARGLLRRFRNELAALDGVAWQALVDAFRPHTNAIWASLSTVERSRFLRKLRPRWDLARHRAPRSSLAMIASWDGVEVLGARFVSAQQRRDGIEVRLSSREVIVDRIVLCTGPDTRLGASPLYRSLLANGHAQVDPLRLGLVTDENGRVTNAHGSPSSWLHALGGVTRPALWENVAVPDLRVQAEAMAARLAP